MAVKREGRLFEVIVIVVRIQRFGRIRELRWTAIGASEREGGWLRPLPRSIVSTSPTVTVRNPIMRRRGVHNRGRCPCCHCLPEFGRCWIGGSGEEEGSMPEDEQEGMELKLVFGQL